MDIFSLLPNSYTWLECMDSWHCFWTLFREVCSWWAWSMGQKNSGWEKVCQNEQLSLHCSSIHQSMGLVLYLSYWRRDKKSAKTRTLSVKYLSNYCIFTVSCAIPLGGCSFCGIWQFMIIVKRMFFSALRTWMGWIVYYMAACVQTHRLRLKVFPFCIP